jgi:hypothetical protein
MAVSHAWMSPRASRRGYGMRHWMSSFGFGGRACAAASCVYSVGVGDDWTCLRRRFPDVKVRLGGLPSAGTRKAATEQDAAIPRLVGRKAWVRALRKHVCAALIEGWREGGEGECSCPQHLSFFFD